MKKTLIASAVGLVFTNVAIAEKPTFSSNDDLRNVHNQCIIQFNNNVDKGSVRGLANGLARKGGTSVKHVYKHSIKGFTANMPCSAAEKAFGGDANIASMTPDSIVSISFRGRPGGGGGGTGGQQVSYGTGRVGGPVDGSGRTAWVIDSGVDLDHPDLNIDVARSFSVQGDANDKNGHGTHVAGTIGALDNGIGALGVAPGTTIVPVKVLGNSGRGTTSGVISGVDHVAANASPGDCANMSLGGGASDALDAAVVAAAASSGAFFVLAAGNDSDHANNHSPARANGNNVYTISSMTNGDNWSSFSNFGNPPVDYVAPGSGIFSLWKDGGTNTISGTSMASPHACAVLMMTNGNPSTDGTVNGDPDGNPDPIIHL